jgi:hypothetical protein
VCLGLIAVLGSISDTPAVNDKPASPLAIIFRHKYYPESVAFLSSIRPARVESAKKVDSLQAIPHRELLFV